MWSRVQKIRYTGAQKISCKSEVIYEILNFHTATLRKSSETDAQRYERSKV